MLDPVGNDNKFARLQVDDFITKIHTQLPCHNQKKFIFLVVTMPVESPRKFDDLDLKLVDVIDNLGIPMIGKAFKNIPPD